MTTVITPEQFFEAAERMPLLPAALAADRSAIGDAIEQRRLTGEHQCAFCDERARTALVLGPSDLWAQPRWVDACHRCYRALTDFTWTWRDDADIVRAYDEWQESRSIPAGGE